MKHGTDNYLYLLRRYCFLKEKWTRTGPYRDALVALVQFIQDSLNLSSLPLSNPSCVRRWTIIHGSHRHLIHRLCSFEYQICNVKKNLNSISTQSSGRNVATEQVTHFSSKKNEKKKWCYSMITAFFLDLIWSIKQLDCSYIQNPYLLAGRKPENLSFKLF